MKKFIIYTDGAARGNPGPAAAAFLIQTEDGVMWVEHGEYLGEVTNNTAEYMAVKLALTRLAQDFSKDLPTEVEIRCDSMLIAQQLSGVYKIKQPHLQELHAQVKHVEKIVGRVIYHYIPRAQNYLADRLANIAIDNHQSSLL